MRSFFRGTVSRHRALSRSASCTGALGSLSRGALGFPELGTLLHQRILQRVDGNLEMLKAVPQGPGGSCSLRLPEQPVFYWM